MSPKILSDIWTSIRTWITDWYKDDVLQELVEKQAKEQRKPINQALLTAHARAPEDYGKGLPEKPTDEELFNSFMFSGVDYRGQAQHAMETMGYGAGVTIAVDLAKMFIPPGVSAFLTASVSGNFSAKRASHRFLFVSNQGTQSEFAFLGQVGNLQGSSAPPPRQQVAPQVQTWHPVVMSCMLGKWTNMKGGLGVTVGVKVDSTSLTNISIGDAESFGFGVNLTGSVSGNLDGTWVFATDPTPVHMERSHEKMRPWFINHLHSTTSAQQEKFERGLDRLDLDVNPRCYLTWWIHSKEASAGLSGGVSAIAATHAGTFNDQTIGPGASFQLSAKLPSVKWTAKTSSYRLNLPCPSPAIVQSQETMILYKQVGGQLFGLSMELELGCAVVKPNPANSGSTNIVTIQDPQTTFIPKMTQMVDASPKAFSNYYDSTEHGGKGKTKITETVAPPDLELIKKGDFKATLTSKSLKMTFLEDKFKKLEKTWEYINSMSYETAIVYWSNRVLLEGSGFVVGQSLTLPSLIKYFVNCQQCHTLFRTDIPELRDVKEFVKNFIKEIIPPEENVMPTLQNWIASTDTGDWRRSIKAVDAAVEAYWKHMNSDPWKMPANWWPGILEDQAEQKCKPAEGESPADRARRVCGMLIELSLAEAQARDKLITGMLAGINKWIASKGGEAGAGNNKRFPGVASLRVKCLYERERLDRFASSLDVCKEYIESRNLEVGLAGSLHVSVANLRTFLRDKGMEGAVKDIVNLTKVDKGQVPGAFLIEASFKLSSDNLAALSRMPTMYDQAAHDLKTGFTQLIKKKLEGNFDNSLQYISIRYRNTDTKAANRSFKLGVNVGAAQFGFSVDRVRNAGTEGNFMVSTIWFGPYAGANRGGGWPEKTVPMPVILS
ncbi:MAG: hypothetical protein LLG06_08780 [Desulfobacteraceae bacterium]|nr:hypothetical protein [Desulfobacteraceae bacterium]